METPKFSSEALEYEQNKQKKLLEEANVIQEAKEMNLEESAEMLGDMDEYIDKLEVDLRDRRSLLKSMKDGEMKETAKEEIIELEEQLRGLKEFSNEGKKKSSKIFIKQK